MIDDFALEKITNCKKTTQYSSCIKAGHKLVNSHLLVIYRNQLFFSIAIYFLLIKYYNMYT